MRSLHGIHAYHNPWKTVNLWCAPKYPRQAEWDAGSDAGLAEEEGLGVWWNLVPLFSWNVRSVFSIKMILVWSLKMINDMTILSKYEHDLRTRDIVDPAQLRVLDVCVYHLQPVVTVRDCCSILDSSLMFRLRPRFRKVTYKMWRV